jgi:hypothetical protein
MTTPTAIQGSIGSDGILVLLVAEDIERTVRKNEHGLSRQTIRFQNLAHDASIHVNASFSFRARQGTDRGQAASGDERPRRSARFSVGFGEIISDGPSLAIYRNSEIADRWRSIATARSQIAGDLSQQRDRRMDLWPARNSSSAWRERKRPIMHGNADREGTRLQRSRIDEMLNRSLMPVTA